MRESDTAYQPDRTGWKLSPPDPFPTPKILRPKHASNLFASPAPSTYRRPPTSPGLAQQPSSDTHLHARLSIQKKLFSGLLQNEPCVLPRSLCPAAPSASPLAHLLSSFRKAAQLAVSPPGSLCQDSEHRGLGYVSFCYRRPFCCAHTCQSSHLTLRL